MIDPKNIELLESLIEPWFIFSLVWSIGATCNQNGRKLFSTFLRDKMKSEKVLFDSYLFGWFSLLGFFQKLSVFPMFIEILVGYPRGLNFSKIGCLINTADFY